VLSLRRFIWFLMNALERYILHLIAALPVQSAPNSVEGKLPALKTAWTDFWIHPCSSSSRLSSKSRQCTKRMGIDRGESLLRRRRSQSCTNIDMTIDHLQPRGVVFFRTSTSSVSIFLLCLERSTTRSITAHKNQAETGLNFAAASSNSRDLLSHSTT
jgi:hypothetical protein